MERDITDRPFTVKALTAALAQAEASAVLRIEAEAMPLAPGFHVTEVGRVRVDSLDCGGRRLSYDEAMIQMLDSGTGRPMRVGTLLGILNRTLGALPEVAEAPLGVEANPGMAGLRRFDLVGVDVAEGTVSLTLTARQAVCRPILEAARAGLGDYREVGCCA